jgi:hypothetical protein
MFWKLEPKELNRLESPDDCVWRRSIATPAVEDASKMEESRACFMVMFATQITTMNV